METPMPDDATSGSAGNRKTQWHGEIDPACWAAALEQSRLAEEKVKASFPGGKPFPIPDRECDLTDESPAPSPAWPKECFYAVNDRPIKLVPTANGGLDVLALNLRTGEFERDMSYLARCVSGYGDVETFPDEAAFLARVAEIRTRIGHA
jgi:hypothetical protein